jgi:anti-anti-sigma factor
MEITVSHEQGRVPITVFQVKGDINMATSEELQRQARRAFEDGMRDLVLDLSDVPYMSSAGIRALNDMFRLLRSSSPAESDDAVKKGLSDGTFKSPHLKLVNPNRHVQEVLGMSGVDMFLEIHRNVKDAVASF